MDSTPNPSFSLIFTEYVPLKCKAKPPYIILKEEPIALSVLDPHCGKQKQSSHNLGLL